MFEANGLLIPEIRHEFLGQDTGVGHPDPAIGLYRRRCFLAADTADSPDCALELTFTTLGAAKLALAFGPPLVRDNNAAFHWNGDRRYVTCIY
jgi:hypothetical protein